MRETFYRRNRRGLTLGAWIVGVAGTVVAYYVTLPKPEGGAPAGAPGGVDAPTLQVGALPVT